MESKARQPVNGTTGQVRKCLLNTCNGLFFPKKSNQRFCHPDHKKTYHDLAYKKGEALMTSKGMHAARVENSDRLKNIYALLSDGQWHTGMEVATAGPTTAPGSAIQELKHPVNGYVIESRCEKRTANNRPLWEYRLVSKHGQN